MYGFYAVQQACCEDDVVMSPPHNIIRLRLWPQSHASIRLPFEGAPAPYEKQPFLEKEQHAFFTR